jgi:hypothetical protein
VVISIAKERTPSDCDPTVLLEPTLEGDELKKEYTGCALSNPTKAKRAKFENFMMMIKFFDYKQGCCVPTVSLEEQIGAMGYFICSNLLLLF